MAHRILRASPSGTHQQRPAVDSVMNPPLDSKFFEPLALLDLSFLGAELNGHHALCLAMSPGAVDEYFVIQSVIQASGDAQWTLIDIDGSTPSDPTRGSEWAESFEEPIQQMRTLAAAELVDADGNEEEPDVRLITGTPVWEQSPDGPSGDGWVFVARLNAYELFGSMYVFYHAETRRAHHLMQFT